MPRKARVTPGGMVFHVLNRGVGRRQLFETKADYDAFENIIAETLDKCPMRICGYCLMPNHWHFVMWPEGDEDLGLFMQRLSVTHVTRWQKYRNVVGVGHLYQARFKSFPVETEDYFNQVMLYVERNALRANLCQTSEDWRWGQLARDLGLISDSTPARQTPQVGCRQLNGPVPVVFGTKFAPEKPGNLGKMGGVALWTRSCHSVSHGRNSPQDTP